MRPSCSYSYLAYPSRSPTARVSSTERPSWRYAPCFVGAAALWNDDDLLEDADVVVSNPLQTAAAMLALLHQLENANILPLYIALLLMTPLLLVLARRDDRLLLAASAGIYLAARAFSLNLPTWPVE